MLESSPHTDAQLLEWLKESSEMAFTEIYHRYWKLLFSVAANKLRELHDAEEVVQEVFAGLWKRRKEISIETSLKSYLAASVKYQAWTLMARRQKERKQKAQFVVVHTTREISPAQTLEAKERFDQLLQRVNSLPEKCRLVYLLSREANYSNKEIAHTLQIAEKTVEAHITRALRHVKTAGEFIIIFLLFIS